MIDLKVCTCQMNLFVLMKNYFCGKVDSLLSSTYQTRDHVLVLNSLVFVKQVGIYGAHLFTWKLRG